MATGGVKNVSEWEQIQEEITCAICGDIFCDPKTIPCLHTFCKECLQKSIEVNKKMANAVCCPLCRALLPEGDFNIPTNFRIKRFIEIFQKRTTLRQAAGAQSAETTSRGCGKCEENIPTVSWCIDCQVLLCYDCDEIHKKWKDFKLHKTATVREYLQAPQKYIMASIEQKQEEPKQLAAGEVLYCMLTEDHKETSFDEERTSKLKITEFQQEFKKLAIEKNNEECPSHMSSHNTTSMDLQGKSAANYPLCTAQYDFSSKVNHVLSFKKGDLFYVISKNEEWWFAKPKDSGNEGYIPSTYTVEFGFLSAYEWYFASITEKNAENLLAQSINPLGVFLVRDSETTPGNYFLSVKDTNQVKHYQIHSLDIGGFFITMPLTFDSVPHLILHYCQNAYELCIALKYSCFMSQQPFGPLEIDRNTIHPTKVIEHHDLYDVFKGVWKNTIPIAINATNNDHKSESNFFKEVEVMKQLKHSNIIRLYGICTKEKPMCIITELLNIGNLHTYLKTKDNLLQEYHLVDMGRQIASAMAYLESKNCVHRKLHARNISLKTQLEQKIICKLTNFSYARIISGSNYVETTPSEKLQIKWTAPETLKLKFSTTKSDVWSFGIVLYELVTFGLEPYPEVLFSEVLKLLETGYRMPCPHNCSEKLYEIMLECWRNNAETRPTFETLQWKLEDYYYSNYIDN